MLKREESLEDSTINPTISGKIPISDIIKISVEKSNENCKPFHRQIPIMKAKKLTNNSLNLHIKHIEFSSEFASPQCRIF